MRAVNVVGPASHDLHGQGRNSRAFVVIFKRSRLAILLSAGQICCISFDYFCVTGSLDVLSKHVNEEPGSVDRWQRLASSCVR